MVRVALMTTTRGSSIRRPEGESEATSRVVALCGAKQGPPSFMADQTKKKTPQLLGRMVVVCTSSKICPTVDLSRAPTERKRGGSGTYLPAYLHSLRGLLGPMGWYATGQHAGLRTQILT